MADEPPHAPARSLAARALASTYVHLAREQSASEVQIDDGFWDELTTGQRPQLERGWLVTQSDFSSDWPHWERHPAGEELIILMAGSAELLLELPAGLTVSALKAAGDFVIVPRGVWHTARTSSTASMIFVTHGPGTEHRPLAG